MSRPRRRSYDGRFEIVGRGFPPCRQGQLASGGDDNVGVPSLSIDSVLRHPPLKGLPESANRTKMVHVKYWGENTQGLLRALACDTWNCTENLFWASERPGLVGAGSPSCVVRAHNDL